MTPTELDVPLSPSAEQIRRRMFASVRRGFDPDQVRDYLEQIADQVEKLEKDLKDARLQADTAKAEARSAAAQPQTASAAPQDSQDPYEDLSTRMAGLLRSADEQAQRILSESKEEAATILAQSRGEADRVRTDAQARAEQARAEGEQALRRAREEADRALSGLASRREVMIGQLQQMQSRLLDVARELETAIDHTDVPTDLPEMPTISPPSTSGSATSASGSTGASTSTGRSTTPSPSAPQAPPSPSASSAGDDPIDPRYEDLWSASGGETVDLNLADLGDLDLNLGEESSGEGRRS